MIIYYVALHRDLLGAVEGRVRAGPPLATMSAYEWFRRRKGEKPDRGFKVICKARRKDRASQT